MAIYLRLELITEDEKVDWETIKELFGNKTNTETLRSLIRQTALKTKTKQENENLLEEATEWQKA